MHVFNVLFEFVDFGKCSGTASRHCSSTPWVICKKKLQSSRPSFSQMRAVSLASPGHLLLLCSSYTWQARAWYGHSMVMVWYDMYVILQLMEPSLCSRSSISKFYFCKKGRDLEMLKLLVPTIIPKLLNNITTVKENRKIPNRLFIQCWKL